MATVNDKTIIRLQSCFFLFLLLHLIEELFIVPNVVDTLGLITSIGGMVILLWYIRQINKPIEIIGVLRSRHKIRKGLGVSTATNAIAAVITLLGVWLIQKSGLVYLAYGYKVKSESYYIEGGIQMLVLWGVVCLLVSAIRAVFYECAFRGLIFSISARSFGFVGINLIQAALYTVMHLSVFLRYVMNGSLQSDPVQFVVVFFIIVAYEMLIAVRMGMLRRVTGSIWACMFDHFMFSFVLNMVHVHGTGEGLLFAIANYLFMMAYQLLCMAVTVPYYFKKLAILRERRAKYQQAMKRHHRHTEHSEYNELTEE